jgi:hypothetical protein
LGRKLKPGWSFRPMKVGGVTGSALLEELDQESERGEAEYALHARIVGRHAEKGRPAGQFWAAVE